jgi:predicted component of type VI protein secretion system
VLEDLPVWASSQGHIPLAAMVPRDKLSELSKAGFVVLGCEKNNDTLHLARAQTVSRPEAHEDHLAAMEAKVHVALASQLFVARAAHFLYLLQQDLEPSDDINQVQADVEERLRTFMSAPKRRVPADAVTLQPVETPMPTQQLFAVRLRPPRYILDREISLVLGLQVPTTATVDAGEGEEPEEEG